MSTPVMQRLIESALFKVGITTLNRGRTVTFSTNTFGDCGMARGWRWDQFVDPGVTLNTLTESFCPSLVNVSRSLS